MNSKYLLVIPIFILLSCSERNSFSQPAKDELIFERDTAIYGLRFDNSNIVNASEKWMYEYDRLKYSGKNQIFSFSETWKSEKRGAKFRGIYLGKKEDSPSNTIKIMRFEYEDLNSLNIDFKGIIIDHPVTGEKIIVKNNLIVWAEIDLEYVDGLMNKIDALDIWKTGMPELGKNYYVSMTRNVDKLFFSFEANYERNNGIPTNLLNELKDLNAL